MIKSACPFCASTDLYEFCMERIGVGAIESTLITKCRECECEAPTVSWIRLPSRLERCYELLGSALVFLHMPSDQGVSAEAVFETLKERHRLGDRIRMFLADRKVFLASAANA